jgi:hypothetical protein
LLGNYARDWKCFSTERLVCDDHSFLDKKLGKVTPLGIYDIQQNTGSLYLSTSHDTSEFNCHWVEVRRLTEGKDHYPNAKEIVILADGGWSNSSRSWLYKHYLQLLANKLDIAIRIAHYPPYTSKYNPIEHKLFCHVHRACEWSMFTSLPVVQELMSKTHTSKWLSVSVWIDTNIYFTKKKIPKEYDETVRSIPHRDDVLPQRNYVIHPNKLYLVII